VYTSLCHYIDVDMLRESFRLLRGSSAAGIDRMTVRQYKKGLEERLRQLHQRLVRDTYRAQPVRRVWLDKENGAKRPIGIPVLEDKIVQKAVAMLLEAVYEREFHGFSYGFRPKRNPHQALGALREGMGENHVRWIVDADIRAFFDSMDHGLLLQLLKRRVNDGGIIRLIGKWLNAGVLEADVWHGSDQGTPQGGVISPILANIFLHYVLDEWFVKDLQPHLKGRSVMVRYADDSIIGCEYQADAELTLSELRKRLEQYKLTVNEEKTAIVPMCKPTGGGTTRSSESFDFLGFTHYWGKSRRNTWVIKRRTATKRQRRTKKALWQWCKNIRHAPIKEQWQILCAKLRGHYNYYALRCNYELMEGVRWFAQTAWRYWLKRRSSKDRMTWEKFNQLLERYPLPRPRILHTAI